MAYLFDRNPALRLGKTLVRREGGAAGDDEALDG
jgi:hypothetical protein